MARAKKRPAPPPRPAAPARTLPLVKRPAVRILLICCGVLFAYLLLIAAFEGAGYGNRAGNRLVSDTDDRSIYYRRALFLPQGRTPYLESFSEYPTLGTLSFTVPLLLAPYARMPKSTYIYLWCWFMALAFLATVRLILRSRQEQGLDLRPALVMLSPSLLYFSVTRYDILCVLVSCWSLLALQRRRYDLAYLLLGVGVHVKWYPALMAPVYVMHQLATDFPQERSLKGLLGSSAARGSLVFLGTVALIAVGSILAFTWDGFLVPYRFHSGRGSQYFNLYWLVEQHFPGKANVSAEAWRAVQMGFAALQFGIVPLVLFGPRLRSFQQVVRYSVLAISLFVLFSRIDSPQWILWYLPLALMVVREKRTVLAFLALSVANYFVFPVGFDFVGQHTLAFNLIALTKDVLWGVAIYFMMKEKESDP